MNGDITHVVATCSCEECRADRQLHKSQDDIDFEVIEAACAAYNSIEDGWESAMRAALLAARPALVAAEREAAKELADKAEQDTADAYLGVIKTLEVDVFNAKKARDALLKALTRIDHMRSICRSADHFECAEAFGKCLDIAHAAIRARQE